MVAESKIDPMHQFQISPIAGHLDGSALVFTNSALWMLIVLACIYGFMLMGMKRELVPGRWQMAVEGLVGFVDNMVVGSIGKEGRKYLPWVFTAFMFILFANFIGAMPFALTGVHAFTVTSQFTVTGLMSVLSFAIVLGVGFKKHGLHFFTLFWPKNTPVGLAAPISLIEFLSFCIRPFSLGLRPFIAMFAGHILLEVFGNFIVQGLNAGGGGYAISVLCFLFVAFINALELLVGAIQAYVFALLTSLYINDAEHLH
ncbi:F0F1 ATP synthase subunit A [Sphingomonas sp. ASV193]|uniref:F0F1 ATP synthase subunit A n=1 Tax=Sphingomonas sp. ASV193 TaxID=3144405 RepID=UPI0032E8825C